MVIPRVRRPRALVGTRLRHPSRSPVHGPEGRLPVGADAINIGDFRMRAHERLGPDILAWLEGGAGDEQTLRRNERTWQSIALVPKVLQALAGCHAATRIAGSDLAMPALLAPLAWQCLLHPDAERATAMAAAAQGIGMVLSMNSTIPVEQIAPLFAAPGAGPLWFQMYAAPDRREWLALALRAQAAGARALVLTVDAPLQGVRDRERAAGFRLPAGVLPAHPMPSLDRHDRDAGQLLAMAPLWRELHGFRQHLDIPLWLKGVLHPDDASRALDTGAVAGLIVSNHGGRTLDTAVPPALALPVIRRTVGAAVPLLVDGGIRRGTDIFKAIALGADGVLLGRPQGWALASGGAPAVARWLRLLRDELTVALALTGCRTVADIGPDRLWSLADDATPI